MFSFVHELRVVVDVIPTIQLMVVIAASAADDDTAVGARD